MSRIEDLEKRLSADPNSKIFVQLAEEYRKAGLQEDAIATCRDGLEKHPNYFSARVALGRALLETNALDEARAEFETVLKQVPDNLLALKFLGETLHKLGHLEAALSKYELAATLSPDDADLTERTRQVQAALAATHAGGSPAADAAIPPGEQSTPPTIPPAKQASQFIERQAREMGSSAVSEDVLSMQEEFEDRPVTSIFHRQAREIQDLGSIPLPTKKMPSDSPGHTTAATGSRETPAEPAPRETATIDLGGAKIRKPLTAPAPSPPVESDITPEKAEAALPPAPPAAPPVGQEAKPFMPAAQPVLGEPPSPPSSAAGMGDPMVPDVADDKPGLATATLAELYVSQGHLDRAVKVYRELVASKPNHPSLQSRLEELEMLATASKARGGSPAGVSQASSGMPTARPDDPNVRFLEQAIRELEGWLAALGRS